MLWVSITYICNIVFAKIEFGPSGVTDILFTVTDTTGERNINGVNNRSGIVWMDATVLLFRYRGHYTMRTGKKSCRKLDAAHVIMEFKFKINLSSLSLKLCEQKLEQ